MFTTPVREENLGFQASIYIPPGPRLGDIIIEAKGVCKAYGDKQLMKNVDFSIPQGYLFLLHIHPSIYPSIHPSIHSFFHPFTQPYCVSRLFHSTSFIHLFLIYPALHCTTLHCTALHCIALHCTALHCTAPLSYVKCYPPQPRSA